MSMRDRFLRLPSLVLAFHLLSKLLLVAMDSGEGRSKPRHLLKHYLPRAKR